MELARNINHYMEISKTRFQVDTGDVHACPGASVNRVAEKDLPGHSGNAIFQNSMRVPLASGKTRPTVQLVGISQGRP